MKTVHIDHALNKSINETENTAVNESANKFMSNQNETSTEPTSNPDSEQVNPTPCKDYNPLTSTRCEILDMEVSLDGIDERIERFQNEQPALFRIINSLREEAAEEDGDFTLVDTAEAVLMAFLLEHGDLPVVTVPAWNEAYTDLVAGKCCHCDSREPAMILQINKTLNYERRRISQTGRTDGYYVGVSFYRTRLILYTLVRVLSDAVFQMLNTEG